MPRCCAAGAAPFSLILTSTTGEVLDLANIVTALTATDFVSTTQFTGMPTSEGVNVLASWGWPATAMTAAACGQSARYAATEAAVRHGFRRASARTVANLAEGRSARSVRRTP